MAGTGVQTNAATTYDEVAANETGLVFDPGWTMMDAYIGKR